MDINCDVNYFCIATGPVLVLAVLPGAIGSSVEVLTSELVTRCLGAPIPPTEAETAGSQPC